MQPLVVCSVSPAMFPLTGMQNIVLSGSCSCPWQCLVALQDACCSTQLCCLSEAVPAACLTPATAVSYMPTVDAVRVTCSEVSVPDSFCVDPRQLSGMVH